MMKSQIFVCIFALWLLFSMDIPFGDSKPIVNSDGNYQACGPALADLMQKFCTSGYNSYPTEQPGKRRRRRRSIIRECCIQACSLSNIYSYCYFGPSETTATEKNVATTQN